MDTTVSVDYLHGERDGEVTWFDRETDLRRLGLPRFVYREIYSLLHRGRDYDGFARELGLKVIRP